MQWRGISLGLQIIVTQDEETHQPLVPSTFIIFHIYMCYEMADGYDNAGINSVQEMQSIFFI